MITINYSGEKARTIVEFGADDILVGNSFNKDKKVVSLDLTNTKTVLPIDKEVFEKSKEELEKEQPDVKIVFNNEQSIDTMIQYLVMVKMNLKALKDDDEFEKEPAIKSLIVE